MKKLLLVLALLFAVNMYSTVNAQTTDDATPDSTQTEAVEEKEEVKESAKEESSLADVKAEDKSVVQIIKEKFIEGGWEFMGLVVICLIIGLAVAIERIITLNLSSSNSGALLRSVSAKLDTGDLSGAKDVCVKTAGPIAGLFSQGLERYNGTTQSIADVEKSIIGYGGVEMGKLEKGLSWISLFISLAPMLGFMGTVIGMIGAFDDIQAAGDISPTVVAGGIKVALLTTVAGLIVAIILQLFYNYCVAKIDGIVNDMEDASMNFVDLLIRHQAKNK